LLQAGEDESAYGQELGRSLSQSLEAVDLLARLRMAMRSTGASLRIWLYIDPSASSFQNLTWEYLRHASVLSAYPNITPIHSSAPVLFRTLAALSLPVPRLEKIERPSALAVLTGPPQFPPVDIEAIQADLVRALSGYDLQIISDINASREVISEALLKSQPDLIYFYGPVFNIEENTYLSLTGPGGETDRISLQDAAVLFKANQLNRALLVLDSPPEWRSSPAPLWKGMAALAEAGVTALLAPSRNNPAQSLAKSLEIFLNELSQSGRIDQAIQMSRLLMPDFEAAEVFSQIQFFTASRDTRLWEILPEEAEARYRLRITGLPEQVSAGGQLISRLTVGQRVRLRVRLEPSPPGEDSFELPDGLPEVYLFAHANGLHLVGPEVVRLPVEPGNDQAAEAQFEIQAYLHGSRSLRLELYAEDPATGRLRIHLAEQSIQVDAPLPGEERLPILPALDIRAAPQPDMVLQVETDLPHGEHGPHRLVYRLTNRLASPVIADQPVGEVTISPEALSRLGLLIRRTMQQVTGIQPGDTRAKLLSLGAVLYDRLFPKESAAAFRAAYEDSALDHPSWTWLIVEDGATWIPWELVAPYHPGVSEPRLLSEHFKLGRWVEGLGPSLYGEIPFGAIALAHFRDLPPSAAAQDGELNAWSEALNAVSRRNVLEAIKAGDEVYGVHLLRLASEISSRRDIVPREGSVTGEKDEGREARQARLDLRFKRPLVTMSLLDDSGSHTAPPADEWLLPERVLPFLRAGASAVIGPWWATSEEADLLFWTTFYDLLERRLPLGEAVRRARLEVARALPHRPDWLAYSLFGDPRARIYWPEESEGYASLECLNPDYPLQPGSTYIFQACLASRPPAWYQDRINQVTQLPEEVQALFLAPGLQSDTVQAVPMMRYGRALLRATISLTPTQPGEYPLIVQLMEGKEFLKTMQLILTVGSRNGGVHDR
jgi:hypothetical protein